MNGLKFTAVVLSSILNPLLILGVCALIYLGDYWVALAILPLSALYFAKQNKTLVVCAVVTNAVLFCVPLYLLLLDLVQGAGYYAGIGFIVMGLIYLTSISNIIVLNVKNV